MSFSNAWVKIAMSNLDFKDTHVLFVVHLIAVFGVLERQRVELGWKYVGKVSKWVCVIVGDVAYVPSRGINDAMLFDGQPMLSQLIISSCSNKMIIMC